MSPRKVSGKLCAHITDSDSTAWQKVSLDHCCPLQSASKGVPTEPQRHTVSRAWTLSGLENNHEAAPA